MARNRMIRPEFWEDDKIAKVSHPARLLFIALWNFADDEGYLENRPDWLRVKAFPYEPEINIRELIAELSENTRIEISDNYIHIKNFLRHQKIDKPRKSELSTLFKSEYAQKQTIFKELSGNNQRTVGEHSSQEVKLREVKGSKEKIKEVEVKTSQSKSKETSKSDSIPFKPTSDQKKQDFETNQRAIKDLAAKLAKAKDLNNPQPLEILAETPEDILPPGIEEPDPDEIDLMVEDNG